MGLFMSSMGKGQTINMATDILYKQFIERDIDNFEDFHIALLDIYNTFNAALPGKHYDAPPRKAVEACFEEWKSCPTTEKKQSIFVAFMKNGNLSKSEDYSVMTGLVTPLVAMAVKRAGENVPYLDRIKIIPDVIFVPFATLLALVTVKLTRRISLRRIIVSISEYNSPSTRRFPMRPIESSSDVFSPTPWKFDGSTSTTTENQSTRKQAETVGRKLSNHDAFSPPSPKFDGSTSTTTENQSTRKQAETVGIKLTSDDAFSPPSSKFDGSTSTATENHSKRKQEETVGIKVISHDAFSPPSSKFDGSTSTTTENQSTSKQAETVGIKQRRYINKKYGKNL